MTLEITVRLSCGAHVTNTVRGVRASSTMSAEAAASHLGEKLYGPAFQGTERRGYDLDKQIERWSLAADAKWYAWCWRSGLIEFGDQLPDGHDDPHGGPIVFASGPRRTLMTRVGVVARHGHAEGSLLVPGVPEAAGDEEAFKALIDWLDWCKQRNGKPGSYEVVFGRLEEL